MRGCWCIIQPATLHSLFFLKVKEETMRKGMFGLAVVLCSGMLFAGGCAKEELVKKDEPVAPSQAPVAQPTKQPAQAPVPSEPLPTQPVKESAAVNGVVADSQTVVSQAPEIKLQTVYFD